LRRRSLTLRPQASLLARFICVSDSIAAFRRATSIRSRRESGKRSEQDLTFYRRRIVELAAYREGAKLCELLQQAYRTRLPKSFGMETCSAVFASSASTIFQRRAGTEPWLSCRAAGS
jgi:hypothetical protein